MNDDQNTRILYRNAYILSIIGFIVTLGFGCAGLMIPYLLLYFNGQLTELPEELGRIEAAGEIAFETSVLVSAFMLTRAFFARYFGKLSDKLGRKPLIVLGLLIYTLLSYAYIMSRSWIDLLIIRAIQGISSAMVWPIAEAMIMDSVKWHERGKYMGMYMTSTNLSFIFGPAIGAYVYKLSVIYFELQLPDCLFAPFYVLAIMSLLAFLMSFFTVEPLTSKERKLRLPITLQKIPREILQQISLSLKIIYIMGFANGIAVGFVFPVFNIFVIQYVTSDPVALGWLSTISGAAGILANYPAGYISDRIGRKNIVISGQLITRISTFILPFIRTFRDLLIISITRSIAFNIMSPAYRALQADLVPKQLRGKVFGTVQSLFNAGSALAPLGGLVYKHLSDSRLIIFGISLPAIAIVFWISALIGIFTTILFIIFVKEPEKEIKQKISYS